MAIGNVIEKGSYIYIYDEKGKQLYVKPKTSGAKDGLLGYTASTVNIRKGSYIYTYDEKGKQLSAKGA